MTPLSMRNAVNFEVIPPLGSVKILRNHKGGRGHQNLTKSRRGGVGGGLSIFCCAINVQIPGYFMDHFEFKIL